MASRFEVTTQFGVAVATTPDGRELLADVSRPDGPPPASGWPAVMLIHGGGWREGDRTQLAGYAHLLARAGYACAAVEYGLLPAVEWPTPLEDVQLAWDWWRGAGAGTFDVDPARIAVQGNSAGGHLALLLAARPDNAAAAVIAIYPPTLLTMEREDGSMPQAFLLEDLAGPHREFEVSPVRQVRGDLPPTQLIHGSADALVPVDASLRLYRDLVAAGVEVDLHIHAGQDHAFDAGPLGRTTAREMQAFLDRYL